MLSIQSNSIRGETLQNVAGMVVQEIMEDIIPMFGPGASDAFITRDNNPYYTRDGMEVMKSLTFDNELARYIHHIFFQAAYHQGKKVGDGSTTVIALYTKMYQLIMEAIKIYEYSAFNHCTINQIREKWTKLTKSIVEKLKERAVPLDESRLLSMLYTCTQDPELSVKIFTELKEPILAGAYIMPRQSNIASDFKVTAHTRPLFKVTKQFSYKPVGDTIENAAVLYCNGMLDIVHDEIFAGIAARRMRLGLPNTENPKYVDMTYVIICHGITQATRNALKNFIKAAKDNRWNPNNLNNIVIYSLNEYRVMTPDEIEDIATIITEEKGIGGLVQPITFEQYLYRSFVDCAALGFDPIQDLEGHGKFDADTHIIEKMKECTMRQWTIHVDDVEGIALEGTLGPVAEQRHQELLRDIREEKTAAKKEDLNRRLRRTFGQFIDVEVGSTLLKDGQRKFELILDALLSASEASKNGVLEGNAILHVLRILREHDKDIVDDEKWHSSYGFILREALEWAIAQIIHNYDPTVDEDTIIGKINLYVGEFDEWDIRDFNIRRDPVWPKRGTADTLGTILVTWEDAEERKHGMEIEPSIAEPVGIMSAIIENSILPIELAMTKVFHISGRNGFMDNYINQV